MPDDSRKIVQRLWSYCSILRDDGLSYPDYVEQLTYLLFLKMAHEQTQDAPRDRPIVPARFGWQTLVARTGEDLHRHYSAILAHLGGAEGMLGIIFRGAENKIRDPAKLRLLIVDLIDQRNWSALEADVKGDAYEGLLDKNAQDTKSGAGQYFTPRPLVQAIVECIRPQAGEVIFDPACGTGGFLLAAHDYVRKANPGMTARQRHHLRFKAIRGTELVAAVTRLGAMNLLLHGIGPSEDEGEPPIRTMDSLADSSEARYDVVLTNPPFGKKSSVTVRTDRSARGGSNALTLYRPDFWVSTSNKELNFVQHVASVLRGGGRAAVVVPDGVLSSGGPGEAVRRHLLEAFDVHTLLRLPTGIFYATGVNANVLFFDKPRHSLNALSRHNDLWVFDLRTHMHFTLVGNRLQRADLDEFVACYNAADRSNRQSTWSATNPQGRWRVFDRAAILADPKCRLDLSWMTQTPETTHRGPKALDALTGQIARNLQAALEQLSDLTRDDGPRTRD